PPRPPPPSPARAGSRRLVSLLLALPRPQRRPIEPLEVADGELARGELPDHDRLAVQAIIVLAAGEGVEEHLPGGVRARVVLRHDVDVAIERARELRAQTRAGAPAHLVEAEDVGEAVTEQQDAGALARLERCPGGILHLVDGLGLWREQGLTVGQT